MIIERNMKQAQRVSNGEMVQGYFVQGTIIKKAYIMLESINSEVLPDEYQALTLVVDYFVVDPATVEDVPLKPRKTESVYGDVCPNCSMAFICKNNFCNNCGQRIDWSGEDEE